MGVPGLTALARAAAKETRPLEQAEPAGGVPIYYRISNPERTVRAAVAPEKETRLKKGALRRSWSFCAFHGCGALLETACNMGFLEDDVFLLLEEGFDESDIEELLNMPGAFYDAIAETVYARMDE